MKKLIVLLVMLFSLSGCFYQDVPKYVIDRSEHLCRNHGGTWEITSYALDGYNATCQDGKRFYSDSFQTK